MTDYEAKLMTQTLTRIVTSLDRIADALDKLVEKKPLTYEESGVWGAAGSTEHSVIIPSTEGVVPYNPVTFMSTSGFPMDAITKYVFGNACEDDECQR